MAWCVASTDLRKPPDFSYSQTHSNFTSNHKFSSSPKYRLKGGDYILFSFSGFITLFLYVYRVTFTRSHESIHMPEEPNADTEGLWECSTLEQWKSLLVRSRLGRIYPSNSGKPTNCRTAELTIPFSMARIFSPAHELLLLWEHHALYIFSFNG